MSRRALPPGAWRVAALAAALGLAAGCQRQPEPRAEQFVGKWKSSRLATPLVLHANGEWEIRTEADSVLQYGVWRVQGRALVWTIKQGATLTHDPNPVVSVEAQRFALRERDGSVTRFERIE